MRPWVTKASSNNNNNKNYMDTDLEYDVSYDPIPNPFLQVSAAAASNDGVDTFYDNDDDDDDMKMRNIGNSGHSRRNSETKSGKLVFLSIIAFLIVVIVVSFVSGTNNKAFATTTTTQTNNNNNSNTHSNSIVANNLNNEIIPTSSEEEEEVSSPFSHTENNVNNNTTTTDTTTQQQQQQPCPAITETTTPKKTTTTLRSYDPFEEEPTWYGSIFAIPPATYFADPQSQNNKRQQEQQLGFLQHPSVRNGTLVFCTEGDLYISYLALPFVLASNDDENRRYMKVTNNKKHNNGTSSTNQPVSKTSTDYDSTLEQEETDDDEDMEETKTDTTDNDNNNKNKATKTNDKTEAKKTKQPTTSPTSEAIDDAISTLEQEEEEDKIYDAEETNTDTIDLNQDEDDSNNNKSSKTNDKTKKTTQPTASPTTTPTASPSKEKTKQPTASPTTTPTASPTKEKIKQSTASPTTTPTFSLSSATSTSSIFPAMKLTETIGNVQSPILSPLGDLVAFTATYTGSRHIYILNLNPSSRREAIRVSYLEETVEKIVGWSADSTALYIICRSLEVSLPDSRLYKLYIKRPESSSSRHLEEEEVTNDDAATTQQEEDEGDDDEEDIPITTKSSAISIGQLEPIPLASVVDAAIDSDCIYFVKTKQSSHTIRYVGGTTENIWAWCNSEEKAINITSFYKGTTKSPQIYKRSHLFFLSDYGILDGNPASMNLFAISMPTREELYSTKKDATTMPPKMIPLTSISCKHNGMPLSEYSIDPVRGDVVLRIGADFEILTAHDISVKLSASLPTNRDLLKQNQESTSSLDTHPIRIAVYSDFNLRQERRFPAIFPSDLTSVDIFTTSFHQIKVLVGLRGQVWVTPVLSDINPASAATAFTGGTGQNLPLRRYRVIPGSTVGGIVRVLAAKYIPTANNENNTALILATDPLSPTAELAFYLVDCGASIAPSFLNADELPMPIYGGHLTSGGSTRDGGLGSIYADTLQVSPCGRRAAWVDTDGRIMTMTIPNNTIISSEEQQQPVHVKLVKLKQTNNRKQPIKGMSTLSWSPAGRYIAISHSSANQFQVISIADLGDPSNGKISLGRVVQATPDRFNSKSPVWGRTALDFKLDSITDVQDGATTLYYLSDRDVVLVDVSSPWGTRAPSPYYPNKCSLYALPLQIPKEEEIKFGSSYVGGGAAELFGDLDSSISMSDSTENSTNPQDASSLRSMILNTTSLDSNKTLSTMTPISNLSLMADLEINFGQSGKFSEFARRAYRVNGVPASDYHDIVCQVSDDPSLVLLGNVGGSIKVVIILVDNFPGDKIEILAFDTTKGLETFGMSTSRNYFYLSLAGKLKIVPNTAAGVLAMAADVEVFKSVADTDDLALSIMPHLEYEQIYGDAWRMFRDYFYDPDLHQVDWLAVYKRYKPLVARCSKREELDDVLALMASELSALHVFVYGGEYADPLHGSTSLKTVNQVSSLGAFLKRSTEENGYVILSIHEGDPDFDAISGIYSPLSEKTLGISGQKGLKPGDVILGVNGESVLSVPDINYLLRGLAGRSIRLDVLRMSNSGSENKQDAVIAVPISVEGATILRYSAWEWKTREEARRLADESGFTVGYIHLQDMGESAMDAFTRGFFPDYNKDAMIIDVRHNLGGNIDSWLLDVLQRKAWTYWESRATNITTGGEGWDEMFAFRGHLVVLCDEGSSSDAEGFSRGVSELKLGKLIGKRTWGGGIWFASDNHLVDGGIATAPEIGTYNDKFGWGMGIEQQGVQPDYEVDNNPRTFYDGKDDQLEKAIEVLAQWLKEEPVVLPKPPGPHPNMALTASADGCPAEYES